MGCGVGRLGMTPWSAPRRPCLKTHSWRPRICVRGRVGGGGWALSRALLLLSQSARRIPNSGRSVRWGYSLRSKMIRDCVQCC